MAQAPVGLVGNYANGLSVHCALTWYQYAFFSVTSSGAGSWNANVGYNEASSTSEDLTLRGAVVTANTADITTGTLTVESLQDTHKSENSSMGVNLGVGAGIDSVGKPQSGSGGANFAKGDSEGAITGEQTAILIGNGADSQITANHTNLIGGMIANATWEIPEGADENAAPVLVDHGQLNFSTETLAVEDLRDYSRSSQTGAGLQVSASTTTISATDEGHRMEGKTQATIGKGNVLVGGVALDEHEDFAELNREIDKGQIVTLDQQTGAMNASVTLDNRMFTEAGRAEIKDQHANLGTNMQAVIGGVGSEINLGINLGVRIAGVDNPAATTEKIDDKLGWWGLIPAGLNNGGLLAQLAGQFLPGSDAHQQQMVGATADSPYVLANPEMGWVPITETPGYYLMNPAQQESMANVVVSTNPIAIAAGTATYQNSTNGMLNTPALAMYNAVTQTHDLLADLGQSILVTLNYNPTRGFLADGLESLHDKTAIWSGQSWMATNVAVDTGIFANQVMLARGNEWANFANHSQGNLLNFSGLLAVGLDKDIVFGPPDRPNFTWNMFGSPVNADAFNSYLEDNRMLLTSTSVNSGDFVGQYLGGNHGLYVHDREGQKFEVVHRYSQSSSALITRSVTAVTLDQTQSQPGLGNLIHLFQSSSPHSNYSCVARCGADPQLMTFPSSNQESAP
ncbi:MAG: hemagglutinin repeat-containing protein [Alcanivoracaceae bacterium]